MSQPRRQAPTQRPRGAALLVAMVLLTVVATLSAGMVWQQWRAVQVESAERSRAQSAWILMGALDWARLIVRETDSSYTSLLEPWAQPLAEARLSTFLAVDRDNNADSGPEAFLSGQITDAQSRYNLFNLVAERRAATGKSGTPGTPGGTGGGTGAGGTGAEKPSVEIKVLERLCQAAGLPTATAETLAQGLIAAMSGSGSVEPGAALPPARIDDLRWLGLDEASLAALRPWLTLLPTQTAVNLNTAPREVLAAVIEGIDLGAADRLVQARQRQPFKTLDDARAHLPPDTTLDAARVSVHSAYFEVRGRLRLDDRVLEETSLVHKRSANEVVTLQRQRLSSVLPSAPG